MFDTTDLTDFVLLLEFICNFLENELIMGQNFLLDCVPPSSLDEDHLASQFLEGDVPATEDVADDLRLSVVLLVCEHRHVLLHAADDPHVHAAQVLLQQTGLTCGVGPSLAGHRLTASQLGSYHAHIQQLMDQFVVLDEIAVGLSSSLFGGSRGSRGRGLGNTMFPELQQRFLPVGDSAGSDMACLGFAFEASDRFLAGLGSFPNGNLSTLGVFVARLILFEDRVQLIFSGGAFGLDPSLCKDIRSQGTPHRSLTLLLAFPGFNQRSVLVAFLLYILHVLAVEFNIDVTMILVGSFDCFGTFLYLPALDRTTCLVGCGSQADVDVDVLVGMHHGYRRGRFNFKHNINQLS